MELVHGRACMVPQDSLPEIASLRVSILIFLPNRDEQGHHDLGPGFRRWPVLVPPVAVSPLTPGIGPWVTSQDDGKFGKFHFQRQRSVPRHHISTSMPPEVLCGRRRSVWRTRRGFFKTRHVHEQLTKSSASHVGQLKASISPSTAWATGFTARKVLSTTLPL